MRGRKEGISFKNLKYFKVIKNGFLKKGLPLYGCGSCGGDHDTFCAPFCPTPSCRHDGDCGNNFDFDWPLPK